MSDLQPDDLFYVSQKTDSSTYASKNITFDQLSTAIGSGNGGLNLIFNDNLLDQYFRMNNAVYVNWNPELSNNVSAYVHDGGHKDLMKDNIKYGEFDLTKVIGMHVLETGSGTPATRRMIPTYKNTSSGHQLVILGAYPDPRISQFYIDNDATHTGSHVFSFVAIRMNEKSLNYKIGDNYVGYRTEVRIDDQKTSFYFPDESTYIDDGQVSTTWYSGTLFQDNVYGVGQPFVLQPDETIALYQSDLLAGSPAKTNHHMGYIRYR